ncbi:MAG TPA: AAA family ATPase [Hansschlegelia sp.]
MRLARLDLEKYGAFESRSLRFRNDARLHVVYGPNEAGKTSALAAVSDLLFGFEQRASFAFRFPAKDLRLGGVVAPAAGEPIAFRRRRGNKATLLDADDAPLRDDLLAPLLGGLTRGLFERAFGLGAQTLRQGADDLLAVDGKSGASLFAAASGLRGLDDMRRVLESQADDIFTPQARTKPFNDILRRHEAARQAVRAKELKAGDWTRLNEAIDALEARVSALGERRTAVRTEKARLERLVRAAPAAAAVDEASGALAEFESLPELAPADAAILRRRLDAAETAQREAEHAEGLSHRAAEELASVAVDAVALDAATAIERLIGESGAYVKSRNDLPRVQSEADGFAAELGRLAARLGLADADAVERALPSDAACAVLRDLIAEGRILAEADRSRARALADEREALSQHKAQREKEPPAHDPKPLREALAALAPEIRPLERRAELAGVHETEERAIAEAAARLFPPVASLDRVVSASLPGPEAIARARKDHDALSAEIDRAERAAADLIGRAAKAKAELEGLSAGGPLASPEAIADARTARDTAWRALRGHLLTTQPLDEGERKARVADFDRHAPEADRLADRATEDASRVARHADLARRHGEHLRDAAERARHLATLRKAQVEALDEWRRIWEPAGVLPQPPEDMASWLKTLHSIFDRREKNTGLAAQIAALDAADARLRPELARIAAEAGLTGIAELACPALAARIEARLSTLADRWEQAGRNEARIAEATARIIRLERETAQARSADDDWRSRWSAAATAVGAPPDATIAAAEAALAAWSGVPGTLNERADRLRRVRGMERDAEAFREGVARLVTRFAPELAGLAPEAAARRLHERLTDARAQATRRKEALARAESAAATFADARLNAEEAAAALTEAAAAFPEGTDLCDLLSQSSVRGERRAVLARAREHFLALGEQGDEALLREELVGFERDSAKAKAADLADEEKRLDDDIKEAFAELDRERRHRAELETGVGAEVAAVEQRIAEAELAATAREWAVLKIGALLLGEAVSRHHAAQQDPLITRAGALFATLTGGAFSGFREDYEDDALKLVALRASGETTPVAGLSEGTRDQFYLALRLAFIEDYATRAEPAPFIGDDLFASFDDARTAQGLAALAEIGARAQPILFTHHKAVVDIARETLGDRVDIVGFEDVRL